jgi:Protein of unknown function (DUF3168)
MMDAVLAVRRAIHATLLADVTLIGLLGGPRIHDEPPRAAAGPYIVYGAVEARDWSTGTDLGCLQVIELVVWAGRGSESQAALAIAGRLVAVLHDAPLSLVGHRLVNLRQSALEIGRDARSGLSRAVLRLRCVTETL